LNLTVYVNDELGKRYIAAKRNGLIPRGMLSEAVAAALTAQLERIDQERTRELVAGHAV
jgi:hypothetical protein